MRVQVKICGVTTRECVRAAVDLGADSIGLVFATSPRELTIERARDLLQEIPPFVTRVAVFRHPTPARVGAVITALRPHQIQSEPDTELIGALAGGPPLLPVFHDAPQIVAAVSTYAKRAAIRPAVLIEAAGRGGRGVRPDWSRAAELARGFPLVLAGGLRPDNVYEAILRVRPAGVDVSSGIESSPGVKDPVRIERFVAEVRRAEATLREEVGAP